MVSGRQIRERRERLGLTLDAVAAATRIPVAHLDALELDALGELPAGPYATAYRRAVLAYLALDPSSEEGLPPPATPPQGAPLWVVRLLAGASMVALVAVLGSLGWERFELSLRREHDAATPSQHVVVVVGDQKTKLAVEVDGQTVLDRELAPGERLVFDAVREVLVHTPASGVLRLEWNGAKIVPQGRQDRPRTLRFVDDEQAW